MSEALPTGVVDAEEVKKVNKVDVKEPPKVSPAQDLRDIQALLANGIFPGNVAPAVVKAYHLLEKMAVEIEKNATSK